MVGGVAVGGVVGVVTGVVGGGGVVVGVVGVTGVVVAGLGVTTGVAGWVVSVLGAWVLGAAAGAA